MRIIKYSKRWHITQITQMLAQSQDKLLHISYSTQFHTTTLEYTHKLYKAWKLKEVKKFLKNILKSRKNIEHLFQEKT